MSLTLPVSPGRRWVFTGLAGALVLTASAVIMANAQKPGTRVAADAAIPVVVRSVGHIARSNFVALSGDVEGWRTANIGFLVPGVVAFVGPREGQAVKEGQVLASLDPRDYELNLEMAAAQRERAEDEYGRAKAVFEQKAIPENDFNKAGTALRMARAAEAMAKKKLEDSKVISPMSGVVARRAIEPGEQAGPGFPIFTIVQLQPIQVRVGIPESQIGRIAVGQRTEVVIPSLRNRKFDGRVRMLGIAADPASRTYMAKVEVSNPGNVLRPGMIAEVRIQGGDKVDALTIPAEAVVRDADGIMRVYVYEAKDKRVYARRVDIGTAYGQEVEVRSGLKGSEMIVTGGQHRVREGSLVTARVEAAPAAAAVRK